MRVSCEESEQEGRFCSAIYVRASTNRNRVQMPTKNFLKGPISSLHPSGSAIEPLLAALEHLPEDRPRSHENAGTAIGAPSIRKRSSPLSEGEQVLKQEYSSVVGSRKRYIERDQML